MVIAWAEDFTGAVIDYGSWPDQHRHEYSLADENPSIQTLFPKAGFEGALYAALSALTDECLGREWEREDGAVLKIERALVDANWGLLPSHGRYVGASSKPMTEYRKQQGDRLGFNWMIPNVAGKRAIRHVIYDTNYWKSFIHARLAVPVGDKGSLTLYGDPRSSSALRGASDRRIPRQNTGARPHGRRVETQAAVARQPLSGLCRGLCGLRIHARRVSARDASREARGQADDPAFRQTPWRDSPEWQTQTFRTQETEEWIKRHWKKSQKYWRPQLCGKSWEIELRTICYPPRWEHYIRTAESEKKQGEFCMKTACKSTNIRVELARLQVMELHELREKWRELYGKDAPDCGKVFLRKQLAFRIQELRYGGISETAQSVLEKIGETPKVRPNPGGVIPGTRFEREWKGTIHVVIATDTGFEYNGQNYRSLSGAAFAITGTQWNGKKFFGVK